MEGLWGEGQGLGPVERNPMVCLIASGGWLQVWMDVAWEMEFSPPPQQEPRIMLETYVIHSCTAHQLLEFHGFIGTEREVHW